MAARASQADLFGSQSRLPEGFVYEPELLTRDEEAALLAHVRELPLEESKYKEYTAKRRTVSYGGQYDFSRNRLEEAPPVPGFLLPLREKVARWAGLPPEQFVHALVSEYRPGSPLGWHRDVPNFEVIVGVSLGGHARMRLRPYRPGEKQRREDTIALDLPPRSAYLMRGGARWGWQHAISETKELRYSITFRTARTSPPPKTDKTTPPPERDG
ncbi:MAG TPA: alpha-ketoglutarate-dependent dioxygenase AlkB [Burkholderiales bacterium]|nr:alpha-ketoglutarate-dependent dioxygenase AlkB [Burkholderiales bacterium]